MRGNMARPVMRKPSMQHCRLLLIDDHTLFRTGLRLLLADALPKSDILEAGSVMEAVERHGHTAVDVILLDLQLPGLSGQDGTLVLHRHFPATRIIVVSGTAEVWTAETAARYGVCGFLSKSATPEQIEASIIQCIQAPHPRSVPRQDGRPTEPGLLTPRQLEVLHHLALGRSNKVIARHLGLAENTVRVHVAAILAQLRVSSRIEAVLEAQRRGLILHTP